MNIATAKSISIIDLLAALSHEPVRINGDRYCYRSPIRNETEPSFCVSKKRNECMILDWGKEVTLSILGNGCLKRMM